MPFMNRVFHKYLDSFVVVFAVDILVHWANHLVCRENLKAVLEVLREKNLFGEHKMCLFSLEAVSLLGHVISNVVHLRKIEATVEWERPTSVR
jgi:hypothetical protein